MRSTLRWCSKEVAGECFASALGAGPGSRNQSESCATGTAAATAVLNFLTVGLFFLM